MVSNANLVGKVYFPRLIIPTSSAVVALMDFAVNLAILFGLMIWYGFLPTWRIALLPAFALTAGTNTVQFTNTYTAQTSSSIPDPTAGGWQLNGSSALSATELTLTPATAHQAGSAFWPQAIDPRNITVEYDATIGGGSGADGLGFVLADATRGALPTSLGVEGGGLGFSGIPGIAVALDEYKGTGAPSNNPMRTSTRCNL